MRIATLTPVGTLGALLAFALPTAAAPFDDADIALGAQLHAEHCVACHADKFGGEDGAAIYLREDRRINSPSALEQQVTRCTTRLDLALFPEDERNIAGYLNQHYYRFK